MPKSVHTPAYRLFLRLLRERREVLKLKQRELGRIMQVHHTYVNLCESGERQLNIIELRQWMQNLNIDFVQFVRDLDAELTRQEAQGFPEDDAPTTPSPPPKPAPKKKA